MSRILDVGCGNDSPFLVKSILPQSHYTGLDITDYNQTKPNRADAYIIASPETFAEEIFKRPAKFDAVVSSHNLEHCNDRYGTFRAMLAALKPDGRLFMAFPCEQSINYPKRRGCLNYYDDPTHKDTPPDFEKHLSMLRHAGFDILFSAKNYRPKLLWLIGLVSEPLSRLRNKVLRGTWEYYGFESIIIAKKSAG